MSEVFIFLFLILFAYLLGSIPFAYIIVKIADGRDIRTIGSGNVGATNVARVLGKWGFIAVLFFDMLKGFVPVLISIYMLNSSWQQLIVAIAAIAGHTYTIFLQFKGGKGVATAGGICLALIPVPSIVALFVFLIVFLWKRMVSLASISAAVTLFLVTLIKFPSFILVLFSLVLATFIIYKHRENIKRIINGTENTFKRKTDD